MPVLLFLLLPQMVTAQYNFESCYAFWELTDSLRVGIQPSESAWKSLRKTEGHKRRNVPGDYWRNFKELVTLVYMPGNEDQIAARIENEIQLEWIVRYAEEEDELKAHIHRIKGLHPIDSASHYARAYLPKQYQNCFPQPTIYFSLLDYDANGTVEGINMDLLVSYDLDNFKTGVFAGHEMFHYVVDKCSIKRLKEDILPKHKAVMNALELISEEGTADLIDKSWVIFDKKSPHMWKDFVLEMYVAESIKSIEGVNLALEALADKQDDPYNKYAHWQNLMPLASHIPGMYMRRVIRKNGLENDLINNISNPFSFFYLYNEAAKLDKEEFAVFSTKAIVYLKLLEDLYIVKEK